MARILVLGGLAESLVNFRGELLREMVRLGHEVIACAPDASPGIQQAILDMGVKYRHVEINRTGMNLLHDFRTIGKLVSLFREIKPDVFFGYTVKPVIYGSLAAKIAGVPGVFSMITGLGYVFLSRSIKGRILRFITMFLYRHSLKYNSVVFFQNPDDLQLFLERKLLAATEKALLVNGSGVDIQAYAPVPFPPEISFLLIARLLRDKGIQEYVEAARIVKRQYPRIRFFLAGWIDSNPEAISEQELQSWQDSGVIEYLGKLSDVRKAIAECSVYVLPSYREGTPRTVLEAMAMGRPIITTDAPGCRETVREGENGFLVPVGDAEALADAMLRFIRTPGMIAPMGKSSCGIACEKYDVRKVNAEILATMGLI